VERLLAFVWFMVKLYIIIWLTRRIKVQVTLLRCCRSLTKK